MRRIPEQEHNKPSGGEDQSTEGSEGELRSLISRASEPRSLVPSLFTCHTWVFLLLYPSLSRAVLSTFICEELGGTYYLMEDTRQTCFDNWTWRAWAVLAGVGLVVLVPPHRLCELRCNEFALVPLDPFGILRFAYPCKRIQCDGGKGGRYD